MVSVGKKRIIIIAGPNGAGKTTFARSFLPDDAKIQRFINADLIAAGLSPFAPDAVAVRAGRLMLEEIDKCVKDGASFSFETTLAGRAYAQHIQSWKAEGYKISLIFLKLPDPKMAISRVAVRVQQGGHNIPEATIIRRFAAGWRNFEDSYKNIVNDWAVYDSSGASPLLLAFGENK